MKQKIGNTMKKLIILSLLLCSTYGYVAVTASVDRSQLVVGETFNLIITVDENTNDQPDFTGLHQAFKVLGTSQSSSTRIVNGDYSVEKKWQISLMPLGVGTSTIPKITIGNESSQPIQISITKSDPNAKANGDVFLEVTADKTTAFVKEQIILNVKLFYAIALSEGNLSEPVAANTIVEQLDKGATYTTNRDGRNYTVVEKHYALFAEKNGQFDLNPIIFNGRDNSSRRSFSMFSTGKPVRAISKSLSFDIKPIPQDSIGKDWIPAKNVQLSQEWSKGPYSVGEPITRTITLYVEGLSETQIPNVDLGEIDNIRVYPEQPQTQTEKTATTLKAWKQMKIAMIPTQAGAIRVPEYQLEWFNTQTQKIEQAKLPPVTLQVEAGEFAVSKPEIPNLIDAENKVESSAVKESAESPGLQNSTIQIVEKDKVIWKILTVVFALLWLLTILFYFKNKTAKSKTKNTEQTVKISKNQILASIRNKDIKQVQSDVIYWWNQQHPTKEVTNLSQIKVWVSPSMQKLIDALELQLYNPQETQSFNQLAWLKEVNGKGLNVVNAKKEITKAELPELY